MAAPEHDDFVDRMVAERTERNPEFPKLVESARERLHDRVQAMTEDEAAEFLPVLEARLPRPERD